MTNNIFKSWRTSLLGLALIAGGAYMIAHNDSEYGGLLIIAGLTMLGVKDPKKPTKRTIR